MGRELREKQIEFSWFEKRIKTMSDKTKRWIRAAGIRAIKTVAQTFVASAGTAAVMSEVNWTMVFSSSMLAGLLSLATSEAGLPEVTK